MKSTSRTSITINFTPCKLFIQRAFHYETTADVHPWHSDLETKLCLNLALAVSLHSEVSLLEELDTLIAHFRSCPKREQILLKFLFWR